MVGSATIFKPEFSMFPDRGKHSCFKDGASVSPYAHNSLIAPHIEPEPPEVAQSLKTIYPFCHIISQISELRITKMTNKISEISVSCITHLGNVANSIDEELALVESIVDKSYVPTK